MLEDLGIEGEPEVYPAHTFVAAWPVSVGDRCAFAGEPFDETCRGGRSGVRLRPSAIAVLVSSAIPDRV
jgi:hypothetical protein